MKRRGVLGAIIGAVITLLTVASDSAGRQRYTLESWHLKKFSIGYWIHTPDGKVLLKSDEYDTLQQAEEVLKNISSEKRKDFFILLSDKSYTTTVLE